MTIDNIKEEYVTSEFPLAVTLLCMKLKLIDLRPSKEDPQRYEFVFSKNQIIEQFIAGYWDNSLRLEPKEFWNQCRDLKSRIKTGF